MILRTQALCLRPVYAVLLLVILNLAWISPLQAVAQLPGSVVVTITSPTAGSTVTGQITVSASVSPSGALVAGVQFRLDGANLGGEDTTAPYSVPWNTATASDGNHTLTAVARDTLGLQSTSDPVTVTVSNDTTAPTVTISFPTGGSTVTGTTPVTATASDNVGVAGVRFRLDGADFGAEDTTAPYSISWDTTTATNASHTWTAVARDAAGNQTTSAAVTVTVSNGGAPPPTLTRIQQTDPSVAFSTGWTQVGTGTEWSGGTAQLSTTALSQATFTFTATTVSWIGFRGPQCGIARVYLDGVFAAEVDAYSVNEELRSVMYRRTGLTAGSHTLRIEVTGLRNTASSDFYIVVDAFDVSSSSPAPAITRFQETAPFLTYTSVWNQGDVRPMWSGGTVATSSMIGAQITFSFVGTSISWIGLRGPQQGIARVSLDGVFVSDVDTYSANELYQAELFARTGLTDTGHTLRIEVTGLRNVASAGSRIQVDAFDFTSVVPPPAHTRFEDNTPSVTYTGNGTGTGGWNPETVAERDWSGGTSRVSWGAGQQATFTFTGPSFAWISMRGPQIGIARVYLDGVYVADVDMYSTVEELRAAVFTATGLTDASHTFMVEVTGTRNVASTNVFIVVDAFDVYR